MSKRSALGLLLAIAMGSLLVTGAAAADSPLGIVANSATRTVTVFDTASDTVLGSVSIPGIPTIGDVAIVGELGFVTDFKSQVWVIDLAMSPPGLASGTNPIPISNFGEDISISPDQKFLLVVDGGASQPISVIDIDSRTEINTFSYGFDHNSVDVCKDGSVLVTSISTGNVHRLTIDGAGNLTDTCEVLYSGGQPNNVFCSPKSGSGIVIRRGPGDIRSFTIPGLTLVDTRSLSGSFGICGLINPAGDRVYARSNGGYVDVFEYNSATGEIGATPLISIPILNTQTYYGMDQMALSPDGKKLYVSQTQALNVYDANTGVLLTAITDLNIYGPTGIFIESLLQVPVDIKPGSCPNPLNPKSKGVLPVAVLGTEDFDVTAIDPESIILTLEGMGAGVSPLRWALEDVATPFEGELCECHDLNGDGYIDLTLKFDTQELVTALNLGDYAGYTIPLILSGNLKEEQGRSPFRGEDCIWILKTGKK